MHNKLIITIISYLISQQVFAVKVYQIESNQLFGHIQYSLIVNKKDIKIVKNSNYYDQASFFLAGVAKVKNPKIILKYISNLHDFALSIKKANFTLGPLKTEKSIASPHATRYSLESVEVKRGHVFYNKIEQEFQKIMKEVSPAVKQGLVYRGEEVIYINNFKKVKKPRNDLDCSERRKTRFCLSDKFGFIFEVNK